MDKKLAQDDSVMFERNISVIAAKYREVEVTTAAGDKFRGFISGLDDCHLQLCQTEDQTFVLVQRPYIVQVTETGEILTEHTRLSESQTKRIKDRVRMFHTVAEKFNGRDS